MPPTLRTSSLQTLKFYNQWLIFQNKFVKKRTIYFFRFTNNSKINKLKLIKTMASTTETGHSKNVANFETLITFCKGYGADYKPTEPNQAIAALQSTYTSAKQSVSDVNKAFTPYSKAVENREIAFAPLSKLTTRIVNAFAACKASAQAIDNAKTHASKVKGTRVGKKETPKVDPNNPTAKVEDNSISVSQMSYDSRVNNFEKLIETLKAEPKYNPNETELQVGTLATLLADLDAKNTAVRVATEPLSNARIARDKVLYDETTGLVQIAADVKKYVKSVYGVSSPKYKQISSLAFRVIKAD
jgi:hypothetical protein